MAEIPPNSISWLLFFKISWGCISPDPPRRSMFRMLSVLRTPCIYMHIIYWLSIEHPQLEVPSSTYEWRYIPENRSVLLSNRTILADYIQGFASYMETLGLRISQWRLNLSSLYNWKKSCYCPDSNIDTICLQSLNPYTLSKLHYIRIVVFLAI